MLADLQRAARVALEGAESASRDGLPMTYGNFLIGNAVASLVSLGDWDRADALMAGAVIGPGTAPVASNLLVSSVVLAAWRGHKVTVDRDLAAIDAALARGGHADMRSRLALGAAEAATWCRAYASALGYLLVAADTDAETDELDMRPQVAATGLRLAAEWPPSAPAEVSARQALIRRMLAMAADPRCKNAPGKQAQAYLRTAEAEATRLTCPGDPVPWRAAIEAWQLVPAPHRVGYGRLRLAEALLGQQGQRQQAQAQLSAAQAVADRLGAKALAEEIESLATRARLRPAVLTAPGQADGFGLTQREQEVLSLLCAGRTNPQIAAQLFISPKTASLHVSHILAKLGVATRGEAASLAHRRDARRASASAAPPSAPPK
jgi:DNA-binding CsgD family transcriptional regulator